MNKKIKEQVLLSAAEEMFYNTISILAKRPKKKQMYLEDALLYLREPIYAIHKIVRRTFEKIENTYIDPSFNSLEIILSYLEDESDEVKLRVLKIIEHVLNNSDEYTKKEKILKILCTYKSDSSNIISKRIKRLTEPETQAD